MTKKYDDSSINFSDWKTNTLKQYAKGYDFSINAIGCFSTGDLRNLEGILQELEKRGVSNEMRILFYRV
jgi:hypothetical protein